MKYHERLPSQNFDDASYMQRARGEHALKVAESLEKPEKSVFTGVFNVVVNLDRLVDRRKLPDSTFNDVLRFLRGEEVDFPYKEKFQMLLGLVDELDSDELKKTIHNLLKEEYEWQIRNVSRRFRILNSEQLRQLREHEHPVFTIGMLVAFPEIDYETAKKISRSYTLAAKIADDMMDFSDDVRNGFLYIPREDLDMVSGIRVEDERYEVIREPELDLDYASRYVKFASNVYFKAGDSLTAKIKKTKHFKYFRAMMHSWIEEAEQNLQRE